MIAQQIAKDRPSIFRRMILIGTAPRDDLVASFLAPYENAQPSAVARQLDEKISHC